MTGATYRIAPDIRADSGLPTGKNKHVHHHGTIC